MGRLKSYDRDDVARKAMQSFWRDGFHASSTKELAVDMGVNVYSLFAEFTSKQGLFEAALDVYSRDVVSAMFAKLDKPDAGLQDLRSLINDQGLAAASGRNSQGCFFANTATERGAEDLPSRTMYAAHINRVQKLIEGALQNAVNAGELNDRTSCSDQSALFVATFQGLSVLARSQIDPDIIMATVRAMNDNLDRLTAQPE